MSIFVVAQLHTTMKGSSYLAEITLTRNGSDRSWRHDTDDAIRFASMEEAEWMASRIRESWHGERGWYVAACEVTP